MKKCTSCGSLFPDEGRFCPECGGADAVLIPDEPAAPAAPAPAPQQPEPVQGAYQPPVQPEPAPQGFNQPDPAQQGYYQPPYQPEQPPVQNTYQPPVQGAYQPPTGEYAAPQGAASYAAPPQQPKKKKTGCLIAVIIVGVLFLIVAIAIAIGAKKVAKEMQEELDPNSIIDEFLDELAPDSDTDATVEYTKGELNGDVYVNEWAGLQFAIPEGLTDGSTADYEKYTDEHTDACLVTDDDSEEGQVLLLIEDVSRVNIHYPPDDYLAIITENWLEEGDEEQGWAKTDPYSKTIAGEGYRLVALTNENLDFTQLAACRCVDGKMICILAWGTGSDVEDFLNSIEKP